MNRQSRRQPDDAYSVPREQWSRADPEAIVGPANRPSVSLLTRIAPLVSAALGYVAAYAAARGSSALGGVLLLFAFIALVTFGISLVNFGRAWFASRAKATV